MITMWQSKWILFPAAHYHVKGGMGDNQMSEEKERSFRQLHIF